MAGNDTTVIRVAEMTVPEARSFIVGLLRGSGAPWAKIAAVMRAASSTVRLDVAVNGSGIRSSSKPDGVSSGDEMSLR